MAETQLPLFDDFATDVQDWMENVSSSIVDPLAPRDWCTLELDKSITEATLQDYFDRTLINTQFQTEYDKSSDEGTQFAFLQMEADLIFSIHRCFATRYRGRLMSYRDEASQKNYHTHSAITIGLAKYQSIKQAADQSTS